MKAVVTTGQGGYEQLVYRDVPRPRIGPGEVLVQVLAAGINNTDINTRVGWYDAGWNGQTPFPLIQGADCCGRVVEVAADVAATSACCVPGDRVLLRPCMRSQGFASLETRWLGTDCDGAFAEFVKVPATEVFPVVTPWSDVELASMPCAWGTAENMLHRAQVAAGARLLVTGASGGVGSAVVQLARRRGASVVAVTDRSKVEAVRTLGADQVLCRDDDLTARLGAQRLDVVVDNVAGPGFPALLKLLRRGGTYVSSGAIAGAAVALDMRDFYLQDLSLLGCTAWAAPVFPNLVGYIERDEVRPVVARSFPLRDIALAQAEFLHKRHVGNFVLVP